MRAATKFQISAESSLFAESSNLAVLIASFQKK